MKSLIYSTFREGYGPDQVRRTMTVGELIAFLEDYDEDTPALSQLRQRLHLRWHYRGALRGKLRRGW